MSGEKTEKMNRTKKRGVNSSINAQYHSTTNKRTSRSQHSTPPPQSIPVNQIKESPPSSPSSEIQGVIHARTTNRTKGRKSAPATVPTSSSSNKDSKDNLKV